MDSPKKIYAMPNEKLHPEGGRYFHTRRFREEPEYIRADLVNELIDAVHDVDDCLEMGYALMIMQKERIDKALKALEAE